MSCQWIAPSSWAWTNSVGININKPAVLRTMSMGASIFGSNVVNAPSRIWTDAQQFLLNKASKLKILH